jgi:DNA replication and repair protein RecF
VLLLPLMFWISKFHIKHFKNHSNSLLSFYPEVNCLVGNNGAGKTNILDAIYHIAFTKSFLGGSDQEHIQLNQSDFYVLDAAVKKENTTESVQIIVKKGAKKIVKVNNNEHERLSDHIGLYPMLMIAPNDILLILEGSEERRKFIDGFIAQCDKQYLRDVLAYNRMLEQRNKQLALFAENHYTDYTLLQTYNQQLATYGTSIYQKRNEFIQTFVPLFQSFYQTISLSNENVNIQYQSQLHQQTFNTLLEHNERYDLAAKRTTQGVHKDELLFEIDDKPLKKIGSQGQQKSFIIALKFAQYAYLYNKTNIKPILLLDDIFEKLDEQRLNTLLKMIAKGDFGQIFITDTHYRRLKQVFEALPTVSVKYFNVSDGIINEI